MSRRILDVGQCGPDHATLTRFLTTHFPDLAIERADLPKHVLDKLRQGNYDLVLINRKLDADGSDGLEIIRQIKGDPQLEQTPVMLVTNYAEYQQAAVEAGAEYGFGKLEYDNPSTLQRLKAVLSYCT